MGNHRNTDLNNQLLLLGITVELNFVMNANKLGVQNGIAFYTDFRNASSLIYKVLSELGISCRIISKPSQKRYPDNIQMSICPITINSDEMHVHSYLSEQTHLPAVVISNIVPEYLQELSNLFPIMEDDLQALHLEDVNTMLKSFYSFARKNPKELCSFVTAARTSKIVSEHKHTSSFLLAMKAAAEIYRQFYRRSHSETETDVLFATLQNSINALDQCQDSFQCDSDLLPYIRKFLYDYISNNNDIIISSVDNIDGATFAALSSDNFLLYDTEWYYLPEVMLRTACQPLLDMYNFSCIKENLFENGALYTNSTASRNYTIKKVFVCSYGVSCRPRILKLKKSYFLSTKEFNLEEKEVTKCL